MAAANDDSNSNKLIAVHKIKRWGLRGGALILWLHRHVRGFEFLGLFGYGIELVLELSHILPRLHHVLHGARASKFGVVAIAMIMLGHLAEHYHQVSY